MAVSQEDEGYEIILAGSDLHTSLGIAESQLDSCESPQILPVLSSLLERIVRWNERFPASSNHSGCRRKVTAFHGLRAPTIGIHNYILRIFKYAKCSPSCFVLAYAYIHKLTHQLWGAPITSLNVHRLVITSVMVSAKFLDDGHYNNAYYAKIGGVCTQEMNRLEQDLLQSLGYRLHISVNAFESFCANLEKEAEMGGGYGPERLLIVASTVGEAESQEKSQKRNAAMRCTYSGV